MMTIFAERVKRLQQHMQPNSLLFMPAASGRIRNRDTQYRYRAHSDTLYLTGVNEEELSLFVTGDALHICARTSDPERERWTGKVRGHEFFLERFADAPFSVTVSAANDWQKKLAELARGRQVLYYDFGVDAEGDTRVLAQLAEMAQYARKGIYAPRTITRAYDVLAPLRLIKDNHDIAVMRRAAAISAAAHNAAQDYIVSARGEVSEYAVKALIEHEFMRQGADQLAYPSIVAAGANATVLHYEGTADRAQPGDFILIDAGAELEGYASDITRTTPVGGFSRASAVRRDLYDVVLAAQKAAIAHSRPGNTIEAVHQKAVDVLCDGLLRLGLFERVPDRSAGNEDRNRLVSLKSREQVAEHDYHTYFYMHRTSHFLGLDVHDVGDYHIAGKSRMLEPGMVITVEPGLYFPPEYDFLAPEVRGIGIRIEDDVLITSDGNEILTVSCRS
ncbi:MAG TPA: aminopeptidase P N-terminal domain-containing protein [Turneriella sp.]|nr:aminopeptidase P N-terminal domain-containing protein [Turneriella sp.]HNL55555.1 aminopeptidase P N-terminal domain-containing protein [Turneriella sp.]